MTAGEVARALREERRWEPATAALVCQRCGHVVMKGELVAYEPFYDGFRGSCCRGGR